MTLGGNVCVRNAKKLDYCWVQAVQSLLNVCDKVILCDCDSDDGTRQEIDEWVKREPKLIPLNFPWTDPKGTSDWYPEWINYSRQHLPTDMHIQLDADEILHESDYGKIRKAAEDRKILIFNRLNFWTDHQHLIPEGFCCGTKVLRIAPTNMPIPSDYPYSPAAETMRLAEHSDIRVFHYGFIREKAAFFRKAREVLRIWANAYDPRLEAAEKYDGHWSKSPGVTGWENKLVEYNGDHPQLIKEWLKIRGYDSN